MTGFCRRLNQAVEGSLFGMGLAMGLLVAVQVFFRYALNHSIFWSEELARIMLVWLSFLGASAAYYRGSHASVAFLAARLSPAAQKSLALAGHLLALIFFALMLVCGVKFAYFVRLQYTPALGIPKWLPHAAIPLSALIMLVHCLGMLRRAKPGSAP